MRFEVALVSLYVVTVKSLAAMTKVSLYRVKLAHKNNLLETATDRRRPHFEVPARANLAPANYCPERQGLSSTASWNMPHEGNAQQQPTKESGRPVSLENLLVKSQTANVGASVHQTQSGATLQHVPPRIVQELQRAPDEHKPLRPSGATMLLTRTQDRLWHQHERWQADSSEGPNLEQSWSAGRARLAEKNGANSADRGGHERLV